MYAETFDNFFENFGETIAFDKIHITHLDIITNSDLVNALIEVTIQYKTNSILDIDIY